MHDMQEEYGIRLESWRKMCPVSRRWLLNATTEQQRLMLSSLPFVLWVVDSEMRFIQSHGAGLAKLGFQRGEVVGRSVAEFGNALTPWNVDAHRLALDGESVQYRQEIGKLSFICMMEPVRGDDGTVKGALGTCIEVSGLRGKPIRAAA